MDVLVLAGIGLLIGALKQHSHTTVESVEDTEYQDVIVEEIFQPFFSFNLNTLLLIIIIVLIVSIINKV